MYQMLDMKLAMYIPFIRKMQPGVFVTCADDIEVFLHFHSSLVYIHKFMNGVLCALT